MTMKTYHGSCHCKAVRFEVDLDLQSKGTNRCNCSICWKARSWFAIASASGLRLLAGEAGMGSYQWVPDGKTNSFLHYRFCNRCGVRTYTEGNLVQLGGKFFAVHVPTLDDATKDELAAAPMKFNDMLHDDPDHVPNDVRLL